MLSKKIFTDQKYFVPLTNYGDFLNFVLSTRTVKQKPEAKKATGEDYFNCCIMCQYNLPIGQIKKQLDFLPVKIPDRTHSSLNTMSRQHRTMQ